MEKEYDKFIHHISTLILSGKYTRAISIINFITSQGIKTNQLIIMLSYATKMINGTAKGLEIIEKQDVDGPLIEYAKSQYKKEMGMKNKARQHLGKILNNEIAGEIGKVYEKMNIFSDEKKPNFYRPEDHPNHAEINRSNEITSLLREGRIGKEEAKQMYLEILDQELEEELREQIIKNIKYLN